MQTPDFVTAHAGLPLVIEAFRVLGLHAAAQQLLGFKQRVRGYSDATFLETLVALRAVGGECVDDVRILHADGGLRSLWGRKALPAAETLRCFLNRFHDPTVLEARVEHTAFIPRESAGLKALGAIQRRLLEAIQRRSPKTRATLDVDATVVSSHKHTALPVYEGGRGYQPMQAWWAEQGLWVTSQFRDGNVPAQSGILEMLKESVATLRSLGISEFAVRMDSAGYQHSVLGWLRAEQIPFAISADMSPELKRRAQALPEAAWKPLRQWQTEDLVHLDREWAEVEFVPDGGSRHKNTAADRYLVIRARPRQLDLFADGSRFKYYATVTNRLEWEGERLLRWSHERCGSVEPAHDVLKNELASGILPSYRFGANAAWWQIGVLTHNLLTALKHLALPEGWQDLRPRRLRLLLFNCAGRIVRHGRRMFLRIAECHPGAQALVHARTQLAHPG